MARIHLKACFASFIALLSFIAQLQILLFHVLRVLSVAESAITCNRRRCCHSTWRRCKFCVDFTLIQTLLQTTLIGMFRHYSVLALVLYLHHVENEDANCSKWELSSRRRQVEDFLHMYLNTPVWHASGRTLHATSHKCDNRTSLSDVHQSKD